MPRVGFVNPLFYRLAAINLPGRKPFSAISTSGRRRRAPRARWSRPASAFRLEGFSASEGWDPVTGLGVPNVRNLIAAATRAPRRRRPGTMTSLNTGVLRETAAGSSRRSVPTAVARFRSRIDGPLAIVGSGGSFTTALLWAHLHESAGHPAWALTPYAFAQRRLPAGTRVLVLSAGGDHHDAVRSAASRPRARVPDVRRHLPRRLAARRVRRSRQRRQAPCSSSNEPVHADDLIAVQGVVAFAVVAARIYAGPGPVGAVLRRRRVSSRRRGRRSFVVAFGAGAANRRPWTSPTSVRSRGWRRRGRPTCGTSRMASS